MIYKDLKLTVMGNNSKTDSDIYVYRNDRNIDFNFKVEIHSPYKYVDNQNMIESTSAAYSQIVIMKQGETPVFGKLQVVSDNVAKLTITANMIDELSELGDYDFFIRLYDRTRESAVTIPPVIGQLHVLEPMGVGAEELTVYDEIGKAMINEMGLTYQEGEEPAFNGYGIYNKTIWKDRDIMSKNKMNKIEEAMYTHSEQFITIQSNKLDKNGIVSMANMGQDVKEAMTGGNVAVVGKNAVLKENIVNGQVTSEKTNFIKYINYNNPNNVINFAEIEYGKYLISGGSKGSSDNYAITGKIYVKNGDIIRGKIYNQATWGIMYDANDGVLGTIQGVANNDYRNIGFTINNSNISYVRLNMYKPYKVNQVNYTNGILAEIVTINTVIPSDTSQELLNGYANNTYGYDTQLDLFNYVKKEELQIIDINPLYGKIALFTGDSICYGAGWRGGWAKIIGENNDMTSINYGIGGTTIGKQVGLTNSILERVDTMQDNADYIIFQGGYNDAWRCPLGEITEGYNDVYDEFTFCGAMESLLKKAILKWKGKKIGVIITFKSGENKAKYKPYFDKQKEICEKWSIPYLDLWKASGICNDLPEINNMYFQLQSDGITGDYTHPNEKCYREFLSPKIESWMKTTL